MNAKWCISTLFIILAFLGLSQEHKRTSNQQILLKFAEVELASETAHDEILAVIAKKLEVLGIADIEIVENDGTQLSIRYYSDIDAVSVKEFLSKEKRLSLSNKEEFPSDYPIEELPEKYNLIVSDLHLQADDIVNLNATLVLSHKQADEIVSNSVILTCANTLDFEQDASVDIAYKINRNIALSINNTSQIIPEVRAGPYVNGNS
jgi:hypothetical protein